MKRLWKQLWIAPAYVIAVSLTPYGVTEWRYWALLATIVYIDLMSHRQAQS